MRLSWLFFSGPLIPYRQKFFKQESDGVILEKTIRQKLRSRCVPAGFKPGTKIY